jgi:hypothetical protein
VLLNGRDASVSLVPVGYEFPSTTGDVYDDNWLIIRGEITTTEHSWTFDEPCLLVREAQSIVAWFDSAIDGTLAAREVPPEEWDDFGELLWFTEPLIAFSLARRIVPALRIRVHLSAEASPPGQHRDMFEYFVEIETTQERLRQARAQWADELAAFPARTAPDAPA